MNKFFSCIKDFFDKIFNPKDILTEDEKLAFNIFETALYDDNCIRILNTNISGKKYIVPKTFYETNDTSACIIINSYLNKITIVNHQYKYDILMPQKTCAIMDLMFNNKALKVLGISTAIIATLAAIVGGIMIGGAGFLLTGFGVLAAAILLASLPKPIEIPGIMTTPTK